MQISEAESSVMEILWERSPRTSEEVIAALAKTHDWQEPTVKTLLNRLLKKGAVSAERDGRRYLYTPRLGRDAWLTQTSRSLLDRLFGGRVAPLVAHFGEQKALSRKDIAELRALLEKLDERR